MISGLDTILRGGRVIDPATGRDGVADMGIRDGRIAAVEPALPNGAAREVLDVSGKVVCAGLIDMHGHVYQHVTGKFGLNADMVGVASGVATVVDQGGPSCMTDLPPFGGCRKLSRAFPQRLTLRAHPGITESSAMRSARLRISVA